ncbi:hypothetical protein HPB48_000076 [Haemaphysalis longicornis]|uniref:Uncharacterized protein n=1 Tax=Haemaphysalis longicornis TaxID=44386 RepID=A0A9J6GBM0_HAELO|nr:hypothetical protein HPB48_000076 [Haemaphysalis longicornis]
MHADCVDCAAPWQPTSEAWRHSGAGRIPSALHCYPSYRGCCQVTYYRITVGNASSRHRTTTTADNRLSLSVPEATADSQKGIVRSFSRLLDFLSRSGKS